MKIKRIKNKSLFLLIILIIIIFFIVLLESAIKMNKIQYRKVLVIGIDAMDPKVTEKLISEGKLPNFKKLKEIGDYSKLETTVPPETPVAWSAAATGSNPGRYGIFDFINRDPNKYLPKLNLAREKQGIMKTEYESTMKGVPFWRITSNAKIPTTIIRWPVTFPPEKINGRMLSGLGVIDLKGLLNSYRFYTSEEYDKGKEGSEKIVKVRKEKDIIETILSGPFVRKGKERVEATVPMRIKLNANSSVISINGKNYDVPVGGWSDWIRVKFKTGFMREVCGIFKARLLSINPDFNMYITSVQIDPKNQIVDITHPKQYGKELSDEIGLFYTLGMPEDTKAVTENRIGKDVFFEQIKQIEDERTKMFWYEFDRFKEGIYAFGFDAGDRLKHIFWEDRILEDDGFRITKEIEEYYIEKDKFLGDVLSKIEKNNTSLIIFSDHGFNSFERAVSINTWLVENGYMTLTKEPSEKDAGSLFEYVDWSRTKAYSLGFVSIYINLKGREGKGIVEEKDKENLIDEIMEKLSKLEDSKYGGKVITRLYKGSEVYSGNYVKDAPDIIIGFEQGYRMSWQNAIGGATPEILMDNDAEWTGDHLMDRSHVPGVIFTNFKIKKENPSLIDIAPTLLSLFNLEVPKSMDGKSLI